MMDDGSWFTNERRKAECPRTFCYGSDCRSTPQFVKERFLELIHLPLTGCFVGSFHRKGFEGHQRRKSGGVEEDRTPDLLIANETLYQLSYDPNTLHRFATPRHFAKRSGPPSADYYGASLFKGKAVLMDSVLIPPELDQVDPESQVEIH
jgi:hypothetical protein